MTTNEEKFERLLNLPQKVAWQEFKNIIHSFVWELKGL